MSGVRVEALGEATSLQDRKIRAGHPELPIIMLTARAEEMDVIVGLNAGADDYVAKPFRLAELVARIRARLRIVDYSIAAAPSGRLTGAGIELDTDARRCFVTDNHGARNEIELTTKEFDLLELLMRQPGVTLKREHIMSAVWDENWWGSTRTLDTHISTLRKKILDRTDPPSKIVTVRGVGCPAVGAYIKHAAGAERNLGTTWPDAPLANQ